MTTPRHGTEGPGGPALTAESFARRFMRIRGAHNGSCDWLAGDEPCDWCRLAGEQAAEAVAAILRDARHVRDTGCEGLREADRRVVQRALGSQWYVAINEVDAWEIAGIVVAALAAPAADASASDALAASPKACARCGHPRDWHVFREVPVECDGMGCPCPGYQPATASAAATSEEGGE